MTDKIIFEFKSPYKTQDWTRSEVERLAYLHFNKGLKFDRLERHFTMTQKQFNTIKDYIKENKRIYCKWEEK